MYILELICKIFTKKPKETTPNVEFPAQNIEGEIPRYNEDYEACEHTFLPIDSSNEVFACTKCGILKKRSELKNKNFFMRKEL